MNNKKQVKLWIHGANGRMGNILQECAEKDSAFQLIGGSGKDFLKIGDRYNDKVDLNQLKKEIGAVDLIIDFSNEEGNALLLEVFKGLDQSVKPKLLIATTGLDKEAMNQWKSLAETTAILHARNTSLGVSLTLQACISTFKVLKDLNFDVEIHESHHRYKKDAPSGTALLLADGLISTDNRFKLSESHQGGRKDKNIGLSYTRGGQVFGEHTVSFLGDDEEIRISHRALSRNLFAKGALILGDWLTSKAKGFYLVENIKAEELVR